MIKSFLELSAEEFTDLYSNKFFEEEAGTIYAVQAKEHFFVVPEGVVPEEQVLINELNKYKRASFLWKCGVAFFSPDMHAYSIILPTDGYRDEIKDKIMKVVSSYGIKTMDRRTDRNDLLFEANGVWKKFSGIPVSKSTNGYAYGFTVVFKMNAEIIDSVYRIDTAKRNGYRNHDKTSDIVGGLDESGIIIDREDFRNKLLHELNALNERISS